MTHSSPEVSVIMPVYNAEASLHRAVESVQAQNFDDLEILAVDDGSSDASWAILTDMASQDPRLKLFKLPRNSGAGVARNRAITEAQGRYIAFLDADDEWLPGKLETQIGWMKKEKIAFSCTSYWRNWSGNRGRLMSVPKSADRRSLLKNNTVGTLTAVYDREYFGKRFMPEIRRRQDYGLWLDLLKEGGEVRGLNEPLAIYHQGHASLSSNKFKAARDQWRFFRKVEGLSGPRCLWYFSHYVVNSTSRNL